VQGQSRDQAGQRSAATLDEPIPEGPRREVYE